MRVLLIYPLPDLAPFYLQSPLGLLYLGAALEPRHTVRIYDANVDQVTLDAVVADFDPNVIGVSFTTGCVRTSFSIARQFSGSGRVLIAGGIHPTYRPADCLDAGFDIVARGEVEDSLSDVLENLRPSSPFLDPSFQAPRGYYFRGPTGNDVDTGISRSVDVDRFVPARHLLPSEYHRHYTDGVLMGSRGCVFGCAFCASARTGFRARDPEKIVDEMEYIVNVEHHQNIHFADDIFTLNPKWVKSICEEIVNRGLKCEWSVNSRSDVPRHHWDMFDWMARAGCKVVAFGIESAHQESLNAVQKGLATEKILPVIQRAREAGLRIRCLLMVGLPGGGYVDHLKSIDLVEEILPSQIIVSLTTPYPGTALGEDPERYGIRMLKSDWTSLLQNVYLDSEQFGAAIQFDDISTEEILSFVGTLLSRMRAHGYRSVTEDPTGSERMIKTFLDKPKLPSLRPPVDPMWR